MWVSMTAIGIFSKGSRVVFQHPLSNVQKILPVVGNTKVNF
jgi:hypothetical protein